MVFIGFFTLISIVVFNILKNLKILKCLKIITYWIANLDELSMLEPILVPISIDLRALGPIMAGCQSCKLQ